MRNKVQMQLKRAYILQSFLGQMKAKLLSRTSFKLLHKPCFLFQYSATTQYVQHARLRKNGELHHFGHDIY